MKRPAPVDQEAPGILKKHLKLTANNSSSRRVLSVELVSAEEVCSLLKTQNTDLLVQGLTNLRNQLSIKYNEPPITPQDERLLLVQTWLGDAASVKDLFDMWESASPKNAALQSLIVSLLSTILSLVSSHLTYHAIGYPIIKTLLTPTFTRRLNAYLGGPNNELILVSLKLYNSISTFAGGRERKMVLEIFPWEMKSLPKFLHMRRKSKPKERDKFAKPDIRTLYVSLLLSFIQPDSSSQVKTTFLEQHRDVLLAIFKSLYQDSYDLVRRVLEVSWTGIWSDHKVKRTLKIGLFNEITIAHLLKLYGRSTSEDDDPEHVPADLVHHFLLAICSHAGVGICFRDRGWYPREQDVGDNVVNDDKADALVSRGSKIYNKILSNVLRTLKVNEDPRQQELAIKIMTACPELVASYWPAAALTLEPRLSSRWLANISFFGTIISLPVPTASFLLSEDSRDGSYQPIPPPLSTILESVLPAVNTKVNFTKGLQSASSLVQHSSALTLIKCLIKYNRVVQTSREIAISLEEDEENGQWFKRVRDLEKEVRRRVPEFQVAVAFSQHVSSHDTATSNTQNAGQKSTPNATRTALLAESAQRLLWMYHHTLPTLVAEARFDVAKLLHSFSSEPSTEDEGKEEIPEVVKRLDRVRRLHVIRLLKESDQFSWTGKPSGFSHSYLHVLLKSFIRTGNSVERTALTDLLHHILSQTILFQEDADESLLWLSSLPVTRRTSGSISPDGAALTDEAESVVAFLDDCIQRGMKAPYKYIEEVQALAKTTSTSPAGFAIGLLGSYPSGLLMTMVEQLNAKVRHKLLSPSDVLALASFMRKLAFNLSMKVLELDLLRSVAQNIDEILSEDRLFPDYPVLSAAIRREVKILRAVLSRLAHEDSYDDDDSVLVSEQVAEFLTEVAQLSPPSSDLARAYTAYELVDWVRLVEEPIGPEEINCVIDVVADFYPPAISVVVDHLDLSAHSLWDAIDIEEYSTKFPGCFSVPQLYLHAYKSVLLDPISRGVLSQVLFSSSPTLLDIKRVIRLISHGLGPDPSQDQLTHTLLLLLATIFEAATHRLSEADLCALKEELFLSQPNLKALFFTKNTSDTVREGLRQFVASTLYPVTEWNRALVSDICSYWVNTTKFSLDADEREVATAVIWINHFPQSDLVDLFDRLARAIDEMPSPLRISFMNSLLTVIKANFNLSSHAGDEFRKRLPSLLALRGVLQNNEELDDLIAAAVGDSLPLYSSRAVAVDKSDGFINLSSGIQKSERHWIRSKDPPSRLIQPHQFLEQETWTKSTVHILCSLSYRRAIDQEGIASWLKSSYFDKRTAEEYIPVLFAFLDCTHTDGAEILSRNVKAFEDAFQRVNRAVIASELPPEHRTAAASCVKWLMNLIPPSRLISQMLGIVTASTPSGYTVELLSLAQSVHGKVRNDDSQQLVTMLVETGLQRFVRFLGDYDQHSDVLKIELEGLTPLVQAAQNVQTQYAETLLGVVIQNHLDKPEFVKLVTSTLQVIRLKPLIVNRHLQGILQHPQLNKLCSASRNSETRDAIVELLFALFNLHPSNTCQVTHLEPLIGLYHATLSISDMKLFSIFQLFEEEKKLSIAALFSRWSTNPSSVSSSSLEAIHSLDPNIVLRTSLHYPRWRRLGDQLMHAVTDHDAHLYDPVFVILLFGTMLSESPPSTTFAWVEMFRTNIIGLLVRSLSSKDASIRDLALCNLSALWMSLQTADMLERSHVLYILGLLKNVHTQPSTNPPRRLPSYTTLILLHALKGVFYPTNFTYPLTARFLLQRPELDTTDVPMLYNMLYSSSDDWKKERGWIIRMLADGMMSSEDWRVLKRRHTWDLLASIFQSSHGDHSLQRGILEVLANLTCNPQAILSLVLKSSLLTWIHMQLLGPSIKEELSWTKILANVLFLADIERLDAVTNGQWQTVICQCLSMLLDPGRCANAPALLSIASPMILKLSSMPSAKSSKLSALLDDALGILAKIEVKSDVPVTKEAAAGDLTLPPYSAVSLYDTAQDIPISIWGRSVEMLWQVAMSFDSKPVSWEALTVRVLLWRSIVGAEKSAVGEWARTAVVRNIGRI